MNLRNAERFKFTMVTAVQLATGKLDFKEIVRFSVLRSS